MPKKSEEKIPFQQVVKALLDEETIFPPRYLYRLSDLNHADQVALTKTWPKISAVRRQALLEDLLELSEGEDVLDFRVVCEIALDDNEGLARRLAVAMLDDYELVELLPRFSQMLEADPDMEVRAAVASALGYYTYLGELEELPEATFHRLEEQLLRVIDGADDKLVRRRALEALSYSSLPEVDTLIETAYASEDNDWLVTALFAMGRSLNNAWDAKVLAQLDNEDFSVRSEAIRAAGELSIEEARPHLLAMLDEADSEIRFATVWSLSQIGGEGVEEALNRLLEQSEDEEETEWLETALENLGFGEDIRLFSMLQVDETDEDNSGWDEEDEEDDLNSLARRN